MIPTERKLTSTERPRKVFPSSCVRCGQEGFRIKFDFTVSVTKGVFDVEVNVCSDCLTLMVERWVSAYKDGEL